MPIIFLGQKSYLVLNYFTLYVDYIWSCDQEIFIKGFDLQSKFIKLDPYFESIRLAKLNLYLFV